MASLNKIMLIGRLTRDPELKFLPNGTPKAELRLATSREWKDKNGEKQKETCYVDVIVWSRQAEIAKQYLAKGRQIFVEGRLDYREWEKDGVKRSKHEVVADVVQFLDRGDAGPNGGGEGAHEGEASFSGQRSESGAYGGGGGYGGGGYGGGNGGGGGYGNGGQRSESGGGYSGGGYNRGNAGKTYGGNGEAPSGGVPMTEVMGVQDSDLPF